MLELHDDICLILNYFESNHITMSDLLLQHLLKINEKIKRSEIKETNVNNNNT